MPTNEEYRIAYGKVVAKAWSDPAYMEQLLSDPRGALADTGMDFPPDIEISVVQDSADKRHLVIPPPPPEGEVGDDALEAVAGGYICCCW